MFHLPHYGQIKDLSRFDASFFGISAAQANKMDPSLRILMEVTYEAIADAGTLYLFILFTSDCQLKKACCFLSFICRTEKFVVQMYYTQIFTDKMMTLAYFDKKNATILR
jgi:hypothetical protein